MKKIISIALLLAAVCILASCSANVANNETDAETTIPVTSPEGFEDVTAPIIEDTTAADTEKDVEETTEADDTTAEKEEETTSLDKISTPDEAVAAARAYKGEIDEVTGFKYGYSYEGMMTEGDIEYFKIRVAWYNEEAGKYSKCGYILVAPDGSCLEYDW